MATPQRRLASDTWQLRRTPPTVLLRMAMDAERQQEIAARIRNLRGPKPQRLIAQKAGVTTRAYQAWEAGGGINWENVAPLAKALGVSEEFLIFGRDKPDPSQLERIEAKLDMVLQLLRRDEEDGGGATAPEVGEPPPPPGELGRRAQEPPPSEQDQQRPGSQQEQGGESTADG